jgi:hypothetical protein
LTVVLEGMLKILSELNVYVTALFCVTVTTYRVFQKKKRRESVVSISTRNNVRVNVVVT